MDMLDSFSTIELIRVVKATLVLSVGLFAAVVAWGNLTDFDTNYVFVQHVLRMDTLEPASKLKTRAILSERAARIFYWGVIVIEILIAVCCCAGSVILFANTFSDAAAFHEAKKLAIIGLALGLGLWFIGFQVVAGEWFAMWMSKEWNALPDAARLSLFLMAVLIFVTLQND